MKYTLIKDYKDERFRRVTGVTRSTFEAMSEVVAQAYRKLHEGGNGRPRKLSVEDMILATLEYYREYRTYDAIAASYGLSKPNIYKTIKWVEETLVESGLFNLPGKKTLAQSEVLFEVILVDTTETPICRPEKGQKHYYSGKKNDTQ